MKDALGITGLIAIGWGLWWMWPPLSIVFAGTAGVLLAVLWGISDANRSPSRDAEQPSQSRDS